MDDSTYLDCIVSAGDIREAATTTQPPPVLDLDALAEAERAMTAGPWEVVNHSDDGGCTFGPNGMCVGDIEDAATSYGSAERKTNAAGIVALRNAAPHLIAEARAAVALRAEVTDLAAIRADERARYLRDGARHLAERDHALAALSKAKRLGLEACALSGEASGRADEAASIRAALEAL